MLWIAATLAGIAASPHLGHPHGGMACFKFVVIAGTLLGTPGEGILEVLEHRRAEAAGQDVLLDRHHQVVADREPLEKLGVQRLGEARVGDSRTQVVCGEDLGGLPGDRHSIAEAEQGHPLAALEQLAGPDRDLLDDGRPFIVPMLYVHGSRALRWTRPATTIRRQWDRRLSSSPGSSSGRWSLMVGPH